MMFGTCLKAYNHYLTKDRLKLIHEFVPQFLFMFCLFGYLSILIVSKWLCTYPDVAIMKPDGSSVMMQSDPSLLVVLIGMFLAPGSVSYEDRSYMYAGQSILQFLFLLIAVICVPWMLLGRPMILKKMKEDMFRRNGFHSGGALGANSSSRGLLGSSSDSDICMEDSNSYFHMSGDDVRLLAAGNASSDDENILRNNEENNTNSDAGFMVMEEEEGLAMIDDATNDGIVTEYEEDLASYDFADTMIYNGIHTIEYCLGAVSNTASYLRLWALSLAHSQLSEVLWSMLLSPCFSYGPVYTFLGFALWALLSLGILVGMEGMSAFLHALRLHWVEFQSKFYAGRGHPFIAFTFNDCLHDL